MTFARRDGAEEFVIAINTSNKEFVGTIEAAGNYAEVTPDIAPPLLTDGDKAKAQQKPNVALPALALDAYGYRIFRRRN